MSLLWLWLLPVAWEIITAIFFPKATFSRAVQKLFRIRRISWSRYLWLAVWIPVAVWFGWHIGFD